MYCTSLLILILSIISVKYESVNNYLKTNLGKQRRYLTNVCDLKKDLMKVCN
jgi:hypothetical protein